MEASPSQPPSDSNQTTSALPCSSRTSPPAASSPPPSSPPIRTFTGRGASLYGQLIQTNQQNILIRSLTLKKQKGDSSSKDVKGAGAAEGSKKRPAERVLDSKASAKKAISQTSSRQEGSSSQASSSRDFNGLTVERLRALLKAKRLSVKGKKDELIARLKSSSG